MEKLLRSTVELYDKFPPDSIDKDVQEFDNCRRRKENEWKAKAEEKRQEKERLKKLQVARTQAKVPLNRINNYKTITVVTILALGLYAFLKTSSGLN